MNVSLLSVIVCTYNRADILPICLQSLAEQTLAKSLYEVIVVDNNSTDATQQIAESYAAREENFSLLVEKTQGLSYARNRGWHEARGEYVAYVDDDCQVPPSWGAVAVEVAQAVSPHVFGGPASPFYNFVKPHWFRDAYLLAVDYGDQAKLLNVSEHLAGMNIVFRKKALLEMGGFLPELGMRGKHIGYGEETEMVLRIRKQHQDALVYYEPRLLLYHLARLDKMSLRWNVKRSFADGRYSFRLFGSNYIASLPFEKVMLEFWREVLRLFYDMCLRVWRRDRVRYPFWQNYFYEIILLRVSRLGTLYEHLTGAK